VVEVPAKEAVGRTAEGGGHRRRGAAAKQGGREDQGGRGKRLGEEQQGHGKKRKKESGKSSKEDGRKKKKAEKEKKRRGRLESSEDTEDSRSESSSDDCTSSSEEASGSSTSTSSSSGSSSSSAGKRGEKKKRRSMKKGKKVDWDLLEELWPLEDRPKKLQTKKGVKGQSMSKLMRLKAQFVIENEKKGLGEAVYGRDRKPKAKKFKGMKDDGEKKLHPARFESLPRVEPAKYWRMVPTARSEIFRHLPLQHLGIEGVGESTIVKLHNRKVPVELQMFRKDPITEVRHVDDAMWNYVLILRSLHPADHGGVVLHKVR